MAKTNRNGNIYHNFCKAEGYIIQKIDGPVTSPPTRPLTHGCDYPLFKLERVSPEVIRRRGVVRG